MKTISKETCELMAKLKDAVEKEGAECVISIGKGKYLSHAIYGPLDNIIALLCCDVDQIASKTGKTNISILIKMLDAILNVERNKE